MASDIDMFIAANGMTGNKSDKPVRVEVGYFKSNNGPGDSLMDDADLQAIQNVQKMVELGWFDVEFTMYGCAWWNPADDRIRYRVSSRAGDIYEFWETASREEILVGNMMKLTRKCPVPSGMKELIANEVKQELADQIRQTYPKAFFHYLNQAGCHYDDSAASILWEQVNQLEGVFEEAKLDKFENLIHYAYSCHRITKLTWIQLQDWLKEERRNMEDTFVSKDIFEKNMYGIAYIENDQLRYWENAQREHIYEKQGELEQQGIFVTPVFHRRYWHNYRYGIPDVIRNFKKEFHDEYDLNYVTMIQSIHDAGGLKANPDEDKSKEGWVTVLAEIADKWGSECAATAKRYGIRWNLC